MHPRRQKHQTHHQCRVSLQQPEACKKYGKKVVLDMTGLKLSSLSQIKLLTMISTVDDLNYPEKTEKDLNTSLELPISILVTLSLGIVQRMASSIEEQGWMLL